LLLMKKKEVAVTEIQKGNVTIIIDLKKLSWDELSKLVKYLQLNPLSAVVEVHVGGEVFDA